MEIFLDYPLYREGAKGTAPMALCERVAIRMRLNSYYPNGLRPFANLPLPIANDDMNEVAGHIINVSYND